ncbi:uncharacterized protein LOC126839024 isoform X4 [Adelges cooleyi]|uniref:uncharacterized protein LOC126839024 isoform X3 n=1 Tax=Adelges cooleyi TaxID=133065 RepID=UPI00217F7061|nr:uncharacterized protein LOC126839024 isoform X3 [Adelges cooleyi]XP_050429896.1 uncharacterized protein LOC126839024 isoform X4 [Adelges cooleyi]
MFSKSIILLLCVVSFTVKSITASNGEIPAGTVETASSGDIPAGTVETASSGEIPAEKEETATSERIVDDGSTSTGNKKLKDMTDEQWANLFKQYDTDEDGIISPKEFQNLVFNEFSGFLTVHDADIYKTLISKDKSKTELEMFKNMKPIIYLLTKRTSKVEIGNVNKNDTYSKESFVEVIKENEQARQLFSDANEISEILNLISQKVKWPINWTKLEEILKMVADSLMMVHIYEGFCKIDQDEDGVINVDDLVKAWIGNDSEESAAEVSDTEKSANEEPVTKMIMDGDLNRDGLIDFYEYMLIMSNQ